MNFVQSRTFYVTVLLQLAGPICYGFGNWANVIQYVSGFGMAYAFWRYETHHKTEMEHIKQLIKGGMNHASER